MPSDDAGKSTICGAERAEWREDIANEYGDHGADRWRHRSARLLNENDMLRRSLREVLGWFTEHGSIGSIDSHLRTGWINAEHIEQRRRELDA